MFPPILSHVDLDLATVSGISGSVSIACWIVVYSPQIVQNFVRASTDGLSLAFIAIWFIGDVANVVGSLLQRVLPTMVILAVYYVVCDVILLLQFWWYRGTKDHDRPTQEADGHHADLGSDGNERQRLLHDAHEDSNGSLKKSARVQSNLHAFLWNCFIIVVVCTAGVLGWWLSTRSTVHDHDEQHLRGQLPGYDVLGQVFGYVCAAFYLGSRIPQLLLNYRRKSTDGIALLFFIFACIGNLTYCLSIFAFDPAPRCIYGRKSCEPGEKGAIYARYIAVNASWIAGSWGTLMLDCLIFIQFYLYKKTE